MIKQLKNKIGKLLENIRKVKIPLTNTPTTIFKSKKTHHSDMVRLPQLMMNIL